MSVATRKALYKKMAETEKDSPKSTPSQSKNEPLTAPSQSMSTTFNNAITSLSTPKEPAKSAIGTALSRTPQTANVGSFPKSPNIATGALVGIGKGLQVADKIASPIVQPIRDWSQTPTGQAVKSGLTSGVLNVLPKTKYTEPLQVASDRLVNSASLGALDYLMPQTQAEKWRQENHPVAATIGTLGGYLIPGIGIEKGIMKTLPGLTKVAGESIIKQTAKRVGIDALSGGIMGGVEGGLNAAVNNQDILKGIGKGGAVGAAMGGALGSIIGGVGGKLEANKIFKQGLSKVGESIDNFKFPQIGESNIVTTAPKPDVFLPRNEPVILKKGTMSGSFPVKNIKLVKAETNLNDAIQTLQNKYGTSDIQGAISDIVNDYAPPLKRKINVDSNFMLDYVKKNDGIDVRKLLSDVDNLQGKKLIPTPEEAKLKRVAGAAPDSSYNLSKNISEYSKDMRKYMGERQKLSTKPVEPNSPLKSPEINAQKQTLNASKAEPNVNSSSKVNEPIKTTNNVGNAAKDINASTKSTEPSIASIASIASTSPTKTIVKSTKELPEIHKMTAQEFDTHYGLDKKPSQASIENIVEDVGAKVINKVGSKNISEIVKHYQTKYKLPENIKVSYTLEKNTKKGTTNPIRDANGDITGYRINLNPNQSIEGKVGSLRHEIEHIVDLQSGYVPSANKYKFNPKTDTTGRTLYTNASKGHHQKYGWFEPDYLRRAAVKDALKSGQEVPESVLKEFPELKGTKVTEDIKANVGTEANVDAATKPFKVFESSDAVTQSQPQPSKPNERGFSRNVRTDENMADKIRDSFETAPEMYDQLANKKTLAEAEGKFAKGYEAALKEFETTTSYKPSDVPLSRMLANEAAKRGDILKARAILSQMAEKLTEAGQLGQAARILRKSDPSVFVSFIERQIIRLNEKGSKIYKDKWKELKLSDAQVKELYSLELYNEDAMEKAMNRVYDNLTEQLPVSKWEKFDSWRRMAMLLNPTTHIRNIGGNALMGGLRKTSDTVGALIQKVFLRPGERTQSFGWSFDKNLKSIVDADWVANKADLTKNNRYDIESLNVMNRDKRIFDTAALEWVNNASKNTLEGEDVFFLGRAYRDALGQHMKANGLKQVTESAREYATRRAYEATFKQVNALSNLIAKGKQIPVAGRFVEAAIPFSKTPSNIAMRSLEYSPLGLMKTLYSAGSKQGAAKVIEDLSKSLTGTALAYLGWQLSSLGWARAAKFQSKNAEGLMTATGDQPYSITTPLGTYTFDWAQPTSVPIAMGMAFHDSMEKNANPNKAIAIEKAVSSAIFAGADTLFSMTMLKSITDAIGGKFGSISEGLASIPVNYLQQAYPAIFGKIARSIDEPQRNTYSDSGLDSFRRQMQAKVPGASKYLEPKLDVFGDELKNVGPAQQFISPGFGKEIKETSLTKELKRLYETTKETGFLPKVAPYKFEYQGKTIRLSPKELTAFQRNMGRRNEELMDKLVNSSSYTNASRTDKEKMKALATVSTDSYDYAKEELLKNRNIPEEPKTKSKNKKKIVIPSKKQ